MSRKSRIPGAIGYVAYLVAWAELVPKIYYSFYRSLGVADHPMGGEIRATGGGPAR